MVKTKPSPSVKDTRLTKEKMNALNERDFFHMKKEDGMDINSIMEYIYRDQYKCPYDENEC